jgi:hypothetical protein
MWSADAGTVTIRRRSPQGAQSPKPETHSAAGQTVKGIQKLYQTVARAPRAQT